MKIAINTKKEWGISTWDIRNHSEKGLENILKAFNQASNDNFYFMDYFNQKIIVDSPSSMILCGYPKKLVQKEGFAFFERTISKKEQKRINAVNKKSYEFFFGYPKSKRNSLVFSYNVKVLTADNQKLVLHHKIVPYRLCKNGNLWLSLCHVWISTEKVFGGPAIVNKETGEQYNFIKNKFTRVEPIAVTNEEVMILKWLIRGLTDKETYSKFEGMKFTTFKSRKRRLFKKLEVRTSAGAIHKAHLLGII